MTPKGLDDENTYVLHDKKHALIIDPGARLKDILALLAPNETVDGICLTHGHKDHTFATDDLVDLFHCPVYIHPLDMTLCLGNAAAFGGTPIYSPLSAYEPETPIGRFLVKVLHTPGHTAGSVCLQIRSHLFTGDTLFAQDIGRTDLYSGNEQQMKESLERLKSLRHDLIIHPGHGPESTLSQELLLNPYLK